jgi:hypothetical protein
VTPDSGGKELIPQRPFEEDGLKRSFPYNDGPDPADDKIDVLNNYNLRCGGP